MGFVEATKTCLRKYVTVSVRRLHDIGLSGFLIVLPITLLFGCAFAVIWFEGALNGPSLYAGIAAMVLGFILSLYWMTKKSSPGSNKYGPNPLDGPVTDQLKEVFE